MKIERQTPSGKIVEFEARGEVFARFIGPDAEKNAVEFESIAALRRTADNAAKGEADALIAAAALRAENEKLRKLTESCCNWLDAAANLSSEQYRTGLCKSADAARRAFAALAKEGK